MEHRSPAGRAEAGRVCLIGAGSSGIVAAKILAERGIPFDGFELGSDIGGIWRYRNDSGRSPAYASLQTNTSTIRTQYACYPMPEGPPRFLPNAELLAYFESFADAFDVRSHFSFQTAVTRVVTAEGGYEVTFRGADGPEQTRSYRRVIVAAGHHWDARLPEFAAEFTGVTMHARDYRSPSDPIELEGRGVLVVGIGNSACDIACEVAPLAAHTMVSTRSGAHVLPKTLFGRPIDLWITPLTSRLPVGLQGRILDLLVRLDRGDQRKFGLARPDRGFGEEHPTLSQHLPELVRKGTLSIGPNVAAVRGREVTFVDGSSAEFDVLLCATGYHIAFPFLSPELLERMDPAGRDDREAGRILDNRVRMYHHVVPPECPDLYFLGLVQPLGSIPPLAEVQAEWVADLIEGTAALPTSEEMQTAIAANEATLAKRFGTSVRHTLEVDVYPYQRAIARERRSGRGRRAHP